MQSGFNVESILSDFNASETGKLVSSLRSYFQKNIIWIFMLFIVGFIGFYSVVGGIISFLTGGNQIPDGASIIVTSPMELILLKLRLSAMISFGVVIFVLLIIAARKAQAYGLKPMKLANDIEFEVKVSFIGIILVAIASLVLGSLGLAYAWEVLTPLLLEYLTNDAVNAGLSSEWRLESYIGFIANLCIASVIGFQAPIPTILLLKYEVVKREELIKYRRHIWFVCMVGGAFFSPQILFPYFWYLFLLSLCLKSHFYYTKYFQNNLTSQNQLSVVGR